MLKQIGLVEEGLFVTPIDTADALLEFANFSEQSAIILYADIGGADGINLIKALREKQPRTPIFILNDDEYGRWDMRKSAFKQGEDDVLYGWNEAPDARIINVYLSRIRTQIEQFGVSSKMIQTVWGLGYRIDASPQNAA